MPDMSGHDPAPPIQADAWERWSWIWHAVFAASIVGSFTVLIGSGDDAEPWVWITFAVLPVWHWVGLKIGYRASPQWEEQQWPRMIVIAGDVGLWFLLLTRNPAFYFLLLGLYSEVFRHLRARFAAVGAALITLLIALRETAIRGQGINLEEPLILILLAAGVAGLVIGLYISSIVRQSGERKDLIAQLEATSADLAESVRREAVLEERQRLAREIHDTLAQGFTSIVLHLETALAAMEHTADAPGRERVQRAADTARRNLDEARRVVRDLRPDILRTTSLVEAVRRTAERWGSEHGLATTVEASGAAAEIGGDREVALYRATEESLANVLKHARAKSVGIRLDYGTTEVRLVVRDDGIGTRAPSESGVGGFGLRGMRERAEALGGTAELTSAPNGGTTVTVLLPIPEQS